MNKFAGGLVAIISILITVEMMKINVLHLFNLATWGGGLNSNKLYSTVQ